MDASMIVRHQRTSINQLIEQLNNRITLFRENNDKKKKISQHVQNFHRFAANQREIQKSHRTNIISSPLFVTLVNEINGSCK
jgi:calcineurin-like phosphoesterase family protein